MALALSIPPVPERTTIVIITYIVVVFSIGIQGMALGKLAAKIYPGIQPPSTSLGPYFSPHSVDISSFLRVF